MNERIRILNMVSEGKITAEEAERLLEALDKKKETVEFKDKRGRKSKKLHVNIDPGENTGKTGIHVGIPLSIVQSFGPLITKNIPKDAKAQMDRCGLDIARILEDIDQLAEEADGADIVNIDSDGEDPSKIRIVIE